MTPPFAPRIYDRIGALVTFRPRNGPLELGLGESFRIDSYLQSELAADRALSNDIDLYASLRVLPETTVKLAVRSSYVSFYDAAAVIPYRDRGACPMVWNPAIDRIGTRGNLRRGEGSDAFPQGIGGLAKIEIEGRESHDVTSRGTAGGILPSLQVRNKVARPRKAKSCSRRPSRRPLPARPACLASHPSRATRCRRPRA